jgi:uncharacterized membrane protein
MVDQRQTRDRVDHPSLFPGLLLGIGFGGFLDGIVLHQLLQWHHMVSSVSRYPTTTVAGLEANTVADGLFHSATWFAVAVGAALMFRAWRTGRPALLPRVQLGLVLAGWGLFDVVEGVIDHQILNVHHVRDDLGAPLSWDIGFLVFGALLVAAGCLLASPLRTRGRS